MVTEPSPPNRLVGEFLDLDLDGRKAFLSKRSCNGVDGANLQGFVLARRSGFGRRPAAGSRQPICSARATLMPAGPRR